MDAGNPFLNCHSDVLKAEPETEEEKAGLVDELKERAKKAFQKKDMPVCDALYSKALAVKPDATLYANRSAVRLTMGRALEAKEDATQATKNDAKYTKGWYRLGQACEKAELFSQAVTAYESGKDLEPSSKVWPAAIERTKKAKIEFEAKKDIKKEEKPEPVYEISSRLKRQVDAQNGKKKEIKTKENDEEELRNARGYKIDSQGRKTTYFNNELDDTTKKLIGDIAPKKLDPATRVETAARADGASAWNLAGTFEERNHTTWAKKWIREKFMSELMVDLPPMNLGQASMIPRLLTITEIKDIRGDASTAVARGKKKYVIDLAVDLAWSFQTDPSNPRSIASGTASFPDISGDAIQDADPLDCLVSVDTTTPQEARRVVDSHIKSESLGLRPAVLELCAKLLDDFRASK